MLKKSRKAIAKKDSGNENLASKKNHKKASASRRRVPRSVLKEKPSALLHQTIAMTFENPPVSISTRSGQDGLSSLVAQQYRETQQAPIHGSFNQHDAYMQDFQNEFNIQTSFDSILGQHLFERFEIVHELGHGAFSTIYLAKDLEYQMQQPLKGMAKVPHQFVAIKRIKIQEYNPIGEGEFELLQELNSQIDFDPRHIVSPITTFYADNLFHLVIEPLDSGRPVTLPSICQCHPPPKAAHSLMACPSRQYAFQKLLCQLLSGLHSLHKYGFIHADLTPSNILFMTSSNRIKIIDLGNTIRPIEREFYTLDYELQSGHYRAPEIVLGHGPIESKIDIWSSGVIAIEWLLDDYGGQSLNNVLEALKEEYDRQDYTATSMEDSDKLLWVPEETRDALVRKIIKLFGSVDCYRNGRFYDWTYEALSRSLLQTQDKTEYDQDQYQAVFNGILPEFLLNNTLSEELTEFILSMVATDSRQRKSAAGLLREEWLTKSLLGEWANVLTGTGDDCGHLKDPLISQRHAGEVEFVDDSGFAESPDKDISVDIGSEIVLGLEIETQKGGFTRIHTNNTSTTKLHLVNLDISGLSEDNGFCSENDFQLLSEQISGASSENLKNIKGSLGTINSSSSYNQPTGDSLSITNGNLCDIEASIPNSTIATPPEISEPSSQTTPETVMGSHKKSPPSQAINSELSCSSPAEQQENQGISEVAPASQSDCLLPEPSFPTCNDKSEANQNPPSSSTAREKPQTRYLVWHRDRPNPMGDKEEEEDDDEVLLL